ncbi:MAG TPA: aminomethyltransferase family protein, partial [Terriglobia bacterium]|nr:aminomethyltransferase family protein [Terriglobia bacterium]
HGLEASSLANSLGWEIPERFSTFLEEYHALRDSVGVLDVPNAAILEARGRDRVRFLQGMLTNDVKSLQPGRGCYTALLTHQGRIVADLQVYCTEESLLLVANPSLRQKLLPSLKKYIIADQVQLSDRSGDLGILSLQGPGAAGLLAQIGSIEPPNQQYDHLEVSMFGSPVRLCRHSRTQQGGYDLILPSEKRSELRTTILTAGGGGAAWPLGWEAYNTNRVEAGIPLYGLDMDETHLPLEAGLQPAISFTKGCYMGQEIVARATYRGQINWQLSGLLLPDLIPVTGGTKILKDGKEIGRITSSVYSPALSRGIALGYLRREFTEPGANLSVDRGGEEITCVVASLPFVRV